jgi:nitrite reductase/ring-hydroxylating ferredoxin subunit
VGLIDFFKALLGRCETPLLDPELWRPGDGEVRLDIAAAVALAQPGGAVRLEGDGLADPILVLRDSQGKLRAFLNRCPHGGRRLDPYGGGDKVRCCSVGHSTFGLDGQKISGPAPGGVTPLPTRTEGGELVVSLAGA